jgi:hypothetical protein
LIDLVERVASTFNLDDDLVGGGLPDERLRIAVPVTRPGGDLIGEFGDAESGRHRSHR